MAMLVPKGLRRDGGYRIAAFISIPILSLMRIVINKEMLWQAK
jgi:hypothetical protein